MNFQFRHNLFHRVNLWHPTYTLFFQLMFFFHFVAKNDRGKLNGFDFIKNQVIKSLLIVKNLCISTGVEPFLSKLKPETHLFIIRTVNRQFSLSFCKIKCNKNIRDSYLSCETNGIFNWEDSLEKKTEV